MRWRRTACLVLGVALLAAGAAKAEEPSKLQIGGTTYTKWLWGNLNYDGSTIHANYNGWVQNLERAIRAQVSAL